MSDAQPRRMANPFRYFNSSPKIIRLTVWDVVSCWKKGSTDCAALVVLPPSLRKAFVNF